MKLTFEMSWLDDMIEYKNSTNTTNETYKFKDYL